MDKTESIFFQNLSVLFECYRTGIVFLVELAALILKLLHAWFISTSTKQPQQNEF